MKWWSGSSEDNSAEVVTKGSHGIGGDHGSMFGKVQEPA